jgi:hypothetical protein
MKELYSFTVNLEEEVEKTETREEDGKTVTTTQKIKEEVPYRIILKQPSRKNIEDADLQFSIEMSNCIKKGILTKGMLVKKYSDTGGLMSEDDAVEMTKLFAYIEKRQQEYLKAVARVEGRNQQEEDAIIADIIKSRQRVIELESLYLNLFSNTADTIAQNNVIRWFCLYMTHKQKIPDGSIDPMFPGYSLEQKIESLHEMDEKEDPLYSKVYRKVATFMSFWYFSKNASKEDFEKLDKDIEQDKPDSK